MYKYSKLDNDNIKWFEKDPTALSLFGIEIFVGEIRGLNNFRIDFNYPITAISGKNGSGKTTVLALSACGFHNLPGGFKLSDRKYPYYTFSDFFIQTEDEVPLDGVMIRYKIHYNDWKPSKRIPEGIGVGHQIRRKKKGGKWNDYYKRVNRDVIFLGINRVVPHAEKSTIKTYRRYFKKSEPSKEEEKTKLLVGKILSRDYETFGFTAHSKYRMPVVTQNDQVYSGFNMGAGEDTLFEVVTTILNCPEKSLILIDEIELGLHEEAQRQFIEVLKNMCKERKLQIICTTHSCAILDALPPEGRIFLEKVGKRTLAIPKISSAFAVGKLSGKPNPELVILVEDEIAKKIVEYAMDYDFKKRINIVFVGSSSAVMRHLAVHYVESKSNVCVILDGDQRTKKSDLVAVFMKAIEDERKKEEAEAWVGTRTSFLPGSTWPEAWICGIREEQYVNSVALDLNCSKEVVIDMLDGARRSDKHSEFYDIGISLNMDKDEIASILIRNALLVKKEEKEEIVEYIRRFLP